MPFVVVVICAVISDGSPIMGVVAMFVLLCPLLISIPIERKYAPDFVWNILTFIGIARKFNQKFYGFSTESVANTIQYE